MGAAKSAVLGPSTGASSGANNPDKSGGVIRRTMRPHWRVSMDSLPPPSTDPDSEIKMRPPTGPPTGDVSMPPGYAPPPQSAGYPAQPGLPPVTAANQRSLVWLWIALGLVVACALGVVVVAAAVVLLTAFR
jgi:hypothetical protein